MSDPTVLSPFPFALVPVTHSGNEVSPPEYRDRYYEHSGSSQDISFFQHPVEVYDQQIVFSKGYFSIGILKKRVWWWRTRDKKKSTEGSARGLPRSFFLDPNNAHSSQHLKSSELSLQWGLSWFTLVPCSHKPCVDCSAWSGKGSCLLSASNAALPNS